MIEPALIKRELITEGLQLIVVAILLYHLFGESRVEKRKKILFLAFLSYSLYLLLHMSMRATQAELIFVFSPEVLDLFSHAFKTLFFMTFGYALIEALIEDELLMKIFKSSTILFFLSIAIISLGIIALEGVNLQFSHTIKELVYELAEMIIQVMIINIAYQSWKETRSNNLIFIGIAFSLYLLADITHTYGIVWGFMKIEFVTRHLIRLFALILIAYTLLYHKEEKSP
jgi:hypothetical protein